MIFSLLRDERNTPNGTYAFKWKQDILGETTLVKTLLRNTVESITQNDIDRRVKELDVRFSSIIRVVFFCILSAFSLFKKWVWTEWIYSINFEFDQEFNSVLRKIIYVWISPFLREFAQYCFYTTRSYKNKIIYIFKSIENKQAIK